MFRAIFRNATLLLGLSFLVACTNANDLDKPPVALGNFALGHNVVVAPNMVKGPLSRDADKDKFIAAMTDAMDERFGRYEGDKFYHFGISLEGYVLAQPGIPLLVSPKSILIVNVTVWDDAAGKKLTEKPEQITVIESFGGHTILGSGYTQTEEEQMQGLARNVAKEIQNYLRRQDRAEGWFKDKKDDVAKVEEEVVSDEEKIEEATEE
ncbi:hypothetical protein RXV86_08235 [Alisedimentitalea sp. MJ-SS2]|uniref:hypothetical protein n=1 Tax=Aliisedimentitalea sp. MJ-SS2 TaxID=3049795 RepID=UPI002910082C|nr:hypothetical protein [Alisedimentitalea sp. MJ-SS2]MDU8927368.1 hypothetical protein [Alisedimentitalea sp. MJ-SS2]